MSWGERSCEHYGSCKFGATISTCNVNCPHYVWDGMAKPDSVKEKTVNLNKTIANIAKEIEKYT